MTKFENKNRGSATVVEMCFIFPITLMVVFTMIYLGLYALQNTLAVSYAERAAIYSSRLIAMPGYDNIVALGSELDIEYIDGTYDGEDEFVGGIEGGYVARAMQQHDPYRFLNFFGGIIKKNSQDKIKNAVTSVLNRVVILAANRTECKLDVSNKFLTQSVTVTVTQTFELPWYVKYLGVTDDLVMKAEAQAPSTSSAEFIRNIDLGYDAVDWLMTKLGIGSVDSFVSKIKEVKTKFGL